MRNQAGSRGCDVPESATRGVTERIEDNVTGLASQSRYFNVGTIGVNLLLPAVYYSSVFDFSPFFFVSGK